MSKPKSPQNKPDKPKQPAASRRGTESKESSLGDDALENVSGGAATTTNTYRSDPYKNFKF
jgi:hypothetical protein